MMLTLTNCLSVFFMYQFANALAAEYMGSTLRKPDDERYEHRQKYGRSLKIENHMLIVHNMRRRKWPIYVYSLTSKTLISGIDIGPPKTLLQTLQKLK